MDSSVIELKDSTIDAIHRIDDSVRIHFPTAHMLKTMTGSRETTHWHQEIILLVNGVTDWTGEKAGTCLCTGGEIEENIYTYRDMIPVPLESRGRIHCRLTFRDDPENFSVAGTEIRLQLCGHPRYIEHIRPSSPDGKPA